jgi:hypothetical protein
MDITSLASAAELPIIAAAVGGISQLLKKATKVPSWLLPWLAGVLGAVGGIGATFITNDTNYAVCALVGAVSGFGSSGAYDGFAGVWQIIKDKLGLSKSLQAQITTLTQQLADATKADSANQDTIKSLQAQLTSATSPNGTTGVTPTPTKEGEASGTIK